MSIFPSFKEENIDTMEYIVLHPEENLVNPQ